MTMRLNLLENGDYICYVISNETSSCKIISEFRSTAGLFEIFQRDGYFSL